LNMKNHLLKFLSLIAVTILLPAVCPAQINSGSNGSDGAFNPTTNTVINMADHPNGVYQYTYVNVPTNVTVSFSPNENNTPVYWLVQGDVVINGILTVSGISSVDSKGGAGGPGGYQGGNGANGSSVSTSGKGPGGGTPGSGAGYYNYGNSFLLPLLGGSGGGGGNFPSGGGGGGGAILIATSTSISINGSVLAKGGGAVWVQYDGYGGAGSGGAIRLVAAQINGKGLLSADGALTSVIGGLGRIRFDTFDDTFSGYVSGQFSSGSQFIIIPTAGQLPQLTVASVGGVTVSSSSTGALATPDAFISAQQTNPIPVVVDCANLPLNTLITVSVKPHDGDAVSATGYNDTGTQASSTATVSVVIPRGGGLIYATATTSN
jgi:hypothetical protein